MICSSCGAPTREGAAFCGSCGKPIVGYTVGGIASESSVGGTSFPPTPANARDTRLYAGFWLRLVALIIDSMVIAAVAGGFFFVIGGMFGLTMQGMIVGGRVNPALLGTILILEILAMVGQWLYFALMESSSWEGTIGKKLLGLYVTDLSGNRISFSRATGRYFAKMVSGFILLIGYIMAAFTEKKQALHDMVASTLVLKKS